MKYYIFLFLFFVFLFPAPLRAIGVSPTKIELVGVMPTNTVSKEFTFSRIRAEAPEEFFLSLQGVGKEAIFFPQGETIIFNSGEKVIPILFTLSPIALDPGNYEVKLNIKPLSDLSLNLGLQAKIVFSVTLAPISQYTIYNITIQEKPPKGLPWLYFNVRNTGNMPVPLTYIKFQTMAKDGLPPLDAVITDSQIPPLPPFNDQYIKLPLPDFLPSGVHKVRVMFYNKEHEVIAASLNPLPVVSPSVGWFRKLYAIFFSFLKK